jgi:MscS family membrane protein
VTAFRVLLPALFAALSAAAPAAGQGTTLPEPPPAEASTATTATPPDEEVSELSPRSAVVEYLTLARAGRFDEAARFLDLPDPLAARGPELARKLKLVLDKRLWIDPSKLSPLPAGHPDDGLAGDVDEIGTIVGPGGDPEPVRVVRKEGLDAPDWRFSQGTVSRISSWYEGLDRRKFLDLIPAQLLRAGPWELLWWQWIAVAVFFFPALWGGRLLGWLTRKVLLRLAARTSTSWDEALLTPMSGPFALAWVLIILRAGLPFLDLYEPAEVIALRLLKVGAILALYWATLRAVTVTGAVLAEAPWATANAGARSFLQFSVRFGRIVVIGLGVITAFGAFGVPVNSLLAGLGIGGIAIAFAAQKTVENFFGAISIGVDQPLRVGDFVKVEGTLGTVEAIGLRSTRIRTLDRTIVTIPNGKLADMQIETFAVRDRIRMALSVGLEYGTTVAQMRTVISEIESYLGAHPKVWPDVIVRFVDYGASSLNLDVWAWFQTTDFAEFRDIRQEVLLGIMEIVEKNGCSFAFPTRTVHLVGPGTASVATPD